MMTDERQKKLEAMAAAREKYEAASLAFSAAMTAYLETQDAYARLPEISQQPDKKKTCVPRGDVPPFGSDE